MDYLVRLSLSEGIDFTTAIQMVTLNVAASYAMDRELGSLAPGRRVLASEMAHYTHSRISAVLGIPFGGVATDERGRMDLSALEAELSAGGVATVVVTVGNTGLGAVGVPAAEARRFSSDPLRCARFRWRGARPRARFGGFAAGPAASPEDWHGTRPAPVERRSASRLPSSWIPACPDQRVRARFINVLSRARIASSTPPWITASRGIP